VNKAFLKNILIAVLLTITVFSVFEYILALREKEKLSNTLNRVKEQVVTLENEKQNLLETLKKEKEIQQKLTQRNSGLKEDLKAGKIRLTKLFRDVREKQRSIEQLTSRISNSKAENRALIGKDNKLRAELTRVSQENESLKAELSSIAELKKTQEYNKIVEGNRGFLIKDGKLTYPAKVRIEVIPAIK